MSDTVAADRLKQIIDKAERLEDEKREVAEQIKEVMKEAKSEGFDVKVLRLVLKLRRMAPHARAEQEELLELYKSAVGMA